ncbi:Zinc finger, RING/FYVE/PHD-type [Cynara cardunculus var. scolymus]|uniref:Zinc finger, RING/FYVE/PHD-type n=1 Tax=Cynara cardunculus var. scolymus TaxID=59895 RepID=A0A103XXQ0_CYNCS|nr:Zinc finger, RING/FYVE/PHD-type [Cynara cardunculus var. scolymus]
MSRPYVYQCYAWPTSAASIPNRVVTSVPPNTTRMIFLTLTTIFLNTDTREGPPAITHVWEICYPTNQLSGLIRSAQLAIYGILCDLPGSPVPALRELTVRLMGCITDMVTNFGNTGRTVLPMAALFSCSRISETTGAPALRATVEEEDEDDQEETEEDEEEDEEEQQLKEEFYQQLKRESPLATVSARKKTPCSICLVEIEAGAIGTELPCLHLFHEDCVLRWLTYDFSCPNCRFRMD